MPSAMAIMSFHPFDQAVLNSFLLIKRVVLVAQFNLMWGKPYPLQDSFAFSSTFSADMLPEKDSIPLIHCNGDKRQDMCNSELMLPLTMPSKTDILLAMLHMIRTRAHMLTHSALAVTEGPCHLQPPQTCSGQHPSHLHTPQTCTREVGVASEGICHPSIYKNTHSIQVCPKTCIQTLSMYVCTCDVGGRTYYHRNGTANFDIAQ